MSPHEQTLYAIAEVLHKCVYEIRAMPASEYMGWIAFFEERNRKQEAERGNLMVMEESDMIERLTGGG